MSCISSTHLYVVNKTDTTITVGWDPVAEAIGYVVEYKLNDPDIAWSILPQQTTTQAIIGQLTADSQYKVRVTSICSTRSCTSVSLIVNTLEFCTPCCI
jgi:hypothetical protein